jgi:hypothetical protein
MKSLNALYAAVIPAKAGIQLAESASIQLLDSGFRRNDDRIFAE